MGCEEYCKGCKKTHNNCIECEHVSYEGECLWPRNAKQMEREIAAAFDKGYDIGYEQGREDEFNEPSGEPLRNEGYE